MSSPFGIAVGMLGTTISIADWVPHVVVGTTFTLMGILKLYGLSRGIVGGADKALATRLCGT